MAKLDLLEKIELLNAIGINLSIEKDHDQLLESILKGAMKITCADAGSLYLLKDDVLHFEIVLGDSMGVAMGGKSGVPVTMKPVPLHDENGEPNRRNVVSCSALDNAIINVEDAYDSEDYDFSGTRKFDRTTGYRSKSFLSVPMSDHEDQLIGVLQLINATDPESGAVIPFDLADEKLVSSLTSQAAVALTRKNLIDGLENLLQSLVKLVATAIDEKSPYTGGHCKRVPELTMLLASAVNEAQDGCYAGVVFSDDQLHELEMAAWLHDCGKITTPEYVVDKRTKLETIFDRIDLVDTRIEVLRRDVEIAELRNNPTAEVVAGEKVDVAARLQELEEIRAFLRKVNTGGEFLPSEEGQKIRALAERFVVEMADGSRQPLLSENEAENLCIVKGTLTDAEREMIQNHIVSTINMLESLPFPKHLRNIPQIAGAHHERLDGKGYPNGLTVDKIPLQGRMLALADIFEALTASDRPYRTPVPLSKALTIMGYMIKEGHLDPDLFRLFIDRQLYQGYAEKYLTPEQIDPVNPESIPGYND